MTVLAWSSRDKKTTHPLNLEDRSLRSTQEWERKLVFPPPHFSFDYKTVEGMAPSRPPTCKPHKHPILMNHFLSITLPLIEFFLCWDTKDQSSMPPSNLAIQFSSVAQSCPTLYDLVNRSTPGLPVHHQLPEFTQTHVHRVRDAIQPSHPSSSPSPPAPNPSQHQSLFQLPKLYHSVFTSVKWRL